MREFSAEFSAHIQKECTTLCWVWKVTRRDAVVLGFTDHDHDLLIDGIIYQAASGFTPSDIESRLGFSLDNSAVEGLLSADTISEADLKEGLYGGAAVEIIRVNWQDPIENAPIWSGTIGEISIRSGYFEAELIGHGAKLNRSTGRVFSRLCDAKFGDDRCGLNAADFPSGTVCPRTFSACQDQFANTVNFRGFPYLIGDDAVMAAPVEGEPKDGSSRYTL